MSRVLHQTRSRFGPLLVTDEGAGVRALWAGHVDAVQTLQKPDRPGTLLLPYAKALVASLALAPRRTRFLVVGLGGGTVPSFLRAKVPGAGVTAVELDPAVVRLASRFFGLREDERLRVVVADGARYVRRACGFDVIVLDAFAGDTLPEALSSTAFFAAVRRALAPGGTAIANAWSGRLTATYEGVLARFRGVFPHARVVRAPRAGNRLLVAPPAAVERTEALGAARRLRKELGLRFDPEALLARELER